MSDLDVTALELAEKSLAKGVFDWQAFLVKAAAEYRLSKREDLVPDSTVDESIDSFGKRYILYANARGTDQAYQLLTDCLNVGLATFEELLASTTGTEREQVVFICQRIGNLV